CVSFVLFSVPSAISALSTLSLHDALPIFPTAGTAPVLDRGRPLRDGRRESSALGAGPPRRIPAAHGAVELLSAVPGGSDRSGQPDRKSTRLNSSHVSISYAVFCLKKKNNK